MLLICFTCTSFVSLCFICTNTEILSFPQCFKALSNFCSHHASVVVVFMFIVVPSLFVSCVRSHSFVLALFCKWTSMLLRWMGYGRSRAHQVQLPLAKNKNVKLSWAQTHRYWTMKDCKKVFCLSSLGESVATVGLNPVPDSLCQSDHFPLSSLINAFLPNSLSPNVFVFCTILCTLYRLLCGKSLYFFFILIFIVSIIQVFLMRWSESEWRLPHKSVNT